MTERWTEGKTVYAAMDSETISANANIALDCLKEIMIHSMISLNAFIGEKDFLEVMEGAVKLVLDTSDDVKDAGRKSVRDAQAPYRRHKQKTSS